MRFVLYYMVYSNIRICCVWCCTIRIRTVLHDVCSSAVFPCSILTHGSEAWNINEVVRKKINGANSVMVSVITGKPHTKR